VGKCRTYTVRDDREHIIQAFNMTLAHASNILSVRYLTAEMKKKTKKMTARQIIGRYTQSRDGEDFEGCFCFLAYF